MSKNIFYDWKILKIIKILKNDKDIKSLNIFGNIQLIKKARLKKKIGFNKKLPNTISLFSLFSCLKPNLPKCKVAGIGLVKRVKAAVWEIKCIYLIKDAIEILGNFFVQ